jgi:hypothetical protein
MSQKVNNKLKLRNVYGEPYKSDGRSLLYDLCQATYKPIKDIRAELKNNGDDFVSLFESWALLNEGDAVDWKQLTIIYPALASRVSAEMLDQEPRFWVRKESDSKGLLA